MVPLRVGAPPQGPQPPSLKDSWEPQTTDRPSPQALNTDSSLSTNGNGWVPNPQSRVIKKKNPLPISSLKTGLCYDVRMRYHATVDPEDMHPEDPRRIVEIYNLIAKEGLVYDEQVSAPGKVPDLMLRIKAREVKKEEVLLVHDGFHWDFVEGTKDLELSQLQALTADGDSVYFNNESFMCARLSCGGAIETCRAVMEGSVKNAIAVIRPPGHHAEPEKAMGFCLFNNVSVAARVIMRDFPECKRVLILDWDVHHGNGTQSAFYDDPSVLYMSLHRYQGGKFYPEGPHGNFDRCGAGEGIGRNVNVPWSTGGMCDADYMYAFQKVIMPIALEFNPDLVIISAGFDAAAGDTLGGCFVTPDGYAHMTHMLMQLAKGKVVVCLEGGYNLSSISNSALAVTKVLMGEPPGKLKDGEFACPSACQVVHQCVEEQSKYWRNIRPRGTITGFPSDPPFMADRLDDVIRYHQSRKLYERHKMAPLAIYRDRISTSFENQVVATANYQDQETILFLVHDPYVKTSPRPPVSAAPNPETNRIDLHKAYMMDAPNMYIDWAVGKGYGVIDANIPQALSGEGNDDYDLTRQTEELCIYMWDNYLELSEAKNFIFIGVGEAFVGLTHLLGHRDCRDRVRGCLSFVGDNNLRAVAPNIADEYLPDWYYHNSRVFVSEMHAVWERKTKHKKKFGHLVQCTATDLHEILRKSFGEATAFIEAKIRPNRSMP